MSAEVIKVRDIVAHRYAAGNTRGYFKILRFEDRFTYVYGCGGSKRRTVKCECQYCTAIYTTAICKLVAYHTGLIPGKNVKERSYNKDSLIKVTPGYIEGLRTEARDTYKYESEICDTIIKLFWDKESEVEEVSKEEGAGDDFFKPLSGLLRED